MNKIMRQLQEEGRAAREQAEAAKRATPAADTPAGEYYAGGYGVEPAAEITGVWIDEFAPVPLPGRLTACEHGNYFWCPTCGPKAVP